MVSDPISINVKADRARATIKASLESHGSAQSDRPDLGVSVEEWRRLAREAAKEIGRPVQTVGAEHLAWAVLRDWPADERESAIQETDLRAAVASIKLPGVPPSS